MSGIVIAIDGPAGTGKSTVSKEVARRLGLAYLDTGATYRVATVACMREGVDLANTDDVEAIVATMNMSITLDPQAPRFYVDDLDVSAMIRSDQVDRAVSAVATNLQARPLLQQVQRDVIAREVDGGYSSGRGIVAEGRDITTVIAPDADVRVLMTASEEARLARRAGDRGATDAASLREAVLDRDAKDSAVSSFLSASEGVATLDTTHLTIEEAIDAVLTMAHEVQL